MESLDTRLIPPIPFHDLASAATPEKVSCPQWRIPAGSRVAFGKTRDRGGIQVVVVVMGKHDRINWRKSIELHSGWNPTSGSRESKRGGSLAPDRIDQDVEASNLDQKTRVPDPREREDIRICTRNDEVRSDADEHARVRVGSARIAASLDNRPLEEIHQPMQLG